MDCSLLYDLRDQLVDALYEDSQVIQAFDSETTDQCGWESPTKAEAERIADFTLHFIAGALR